MDLCLLHSVQLWILEGNGNNEEIRGLARPLIS